MTRPMSRRGFLGRAFGAGLTGLGGARVLAAEGARGAPNCEKRGWRFGIAAYTFRHLDLYRAAEQVAALGLHYIEGFTWQRLSTKKPNVVTNGTMPAADRTEAKARLADMGVSLVSCYCQAMAKEDAARKLFEWAKEMGMEVLVAEPPLNAYDMVAKLCDEYGVCVGVHNHPRPSRYWRPETLLKAAQGRTKRIGACCDIGHWARSGIQPVEALRKLQGRIISFHLKDIAKFGDAKSPCVPFGKGEGDIAGVVKEVRRQGIKPPLMIEHEVRSPKLREEVAGCVAYFDRLVGQEG